MTNTKTKIVIALLFAVGFASSAFASDSFLSPNVQNVQQTQQQRYVGTGADAYAQAPAQRNATFTEAERREFDRATESASSR